jgi:hypothetical protein
MRIPYISLVAAGAIALGGCAYDGLGLGMGYGDAYSSGYGYNSSYYGGYGYGSPYYGGRSGISLGVGYGSGYGGYGYGSPYYGSYGYGSPYYGWYGDYYYPGTGSYVYDSYRRPRAMTTTQRQYWSTRSPALRTSTRTTIRPNWSGFTHKSNATARRTAREDRRNRHHNQ